MFADRSRCLLAVFRGADFVVLTRDSFHIVVQSGSGDHKEASLQSILLSLDFATKLFFCPLTSFSSSFWVSLFTPSSVTVFLMFLGTAGDTGRWMAGELDSTGFRVFEDWNLSPTAGSPARCAG